MNKTSGGDGIPVEPFQILKYNALKVLQSICQQNWKHSSGHRTGKGQFSLQFQRKAMPKNVKTTTQLHLSHSSKVMLKFLQARVQQYMTHELLDVKAAIRKGRGTRDQIANIRWIIKRARVPKKYLLLLCWLQQSLWLCGSQQTVEDSSRDRNTRPSYLSPEKSVCRSRNNS